jgi:hypothetical protein
MQTKVTPETFVTGMLVSLLDRDQENAVVRKIFKPIFFIGRGIQDVLGPMGLDVLTEPEWQSFYL